MKILITVLAMTFALGAFAWDDKTDFNLTYNAGLYASEAQALQAGLAIEKKIEKNKFKSVYANGNCEFGSDAEYRKNSIEIKKLYVNGEAKFQANVNYIMSCEEEYQM